MFSIFLIGKSRRFIQTYSWPLKPILATGTAINNFVLQKNVKKRDLKPFSNLKKRQKRHRLAEYRHHLNEVMSQNNLSDADQADMLLHYSNEKKIEVFALLHQ